MEDIIKQLQSIITSYGMQIIGAIVTLIIGIWISKLLAKSLGKVLRKREVDETLIKFSVSLVKVALITFVAK